MLIRAVAFGGLLVVLPSRARASCADADGPLPPSYPDPKEDGYAGADLQAMTFAGATF